MGTKIYIVSGDCRVHIMHEYVPGMIRKGDGTAVCYELALTTVNPLVPVRLMQKATSIPGIGVLERRGEE